jgi:hypothetical protein
MHDTHLPPNVCQKLSVIPACRVVDHTQVIPATQEIVQTATIDLGGRKMLSSRKMLGQDGSGTQVMINTTANVLSRFSYRHCPTTNLPWADVASYTDTDYTRYGDLIHDAGICLTTGNGVGKVNTTADNTGIVSALSLQHGAQMQELGVSCLPDMSLPAHSYAQQHRHCFPVDGLQGRELAQPCLMLAQPGLAYPATPHTTCCV